MSDSISRQDAIDAADKIIERDTSGNNDVVKAMTAWKSYIQQLPSAQPERKTGRWIVYYHTPKDFSYSCNQCGYSAPYGLYGGEYSQKKWNYCPNCGAKMQIDKLDT